MASGICSPITLECHFMIVWAMGGIGIEIEGDFFVVLFYDEYLNDF